MFCIGEGVGGTFSLAPLSDDASDVQQSLLQKKQQKKKTGVNGVILEPKRGLKSLFHADDSFGTQMLQLPVADRSGNKVTRISFSEFTVHFTVK